MTTSARTSAGVPLVYAVDFGGADAVTNGTPYKTAYGVPKVKFASSENQSNRHKSNDTDLVIASSIATNSNPHRSVTGIRKVCIVDQYGIRPGQSALAANESIRRTPEGIEKVCLSDLWGNPIAPMNITSSWPLASGGAVDLTDYGPNGYNLTNNGSVARGAGPSTNLPDAIVCVRSVPSFLSRSGMPFLPGSSPFGISIWAWRSTDVTDGFSSPISVYAGTTERAWLLERVTSTSRWNFNASADGAAITTSPTSTAATQDGGTQAWAFVAVWWDGTELNCQVNMGTIASKAFAGPVFASTADLQIGNNTAPFRWDGRLAQALYGPVPSQPELAWRYNGGNGRDLSKAA